MMNTQYVEYVRGCVIIALSDIKRSGKGQLAAFEDSPIAITTSYKRKRQRIIELDDRKVCSAAQPMHCPETRSRKSTLPLIDPLSYSFASWRRALSSMAPQYLSWLRYCYADDTNYDHQVKLCQHVWREFGNKRRDTRLAAKTLARLEKLAWLAVQDAKNMICGSATYSAGKLAKLTGVTATNWSENYSDHWRALINIVIDLDHDALLALSRARSQQKHELSQQVLAKMN
ncbi:bacteriophage antitermination protein Q [Dickeya dadantii]|uniref:bacteriophage antitermination protein Q n=1 Tax=Dickeya dadantii TaxID=204038 RepID=UPI001CF4D4A7|nr:bacteriophage antitermination protein Q [Dickeya dadantii]MCA7012504.1 bacteriophage antitermination protein Q [Dickeya dadantii]